MEKYISKIKDKCDLYGINPDTLTDSEKERLVDEIKASERGELVCRSVLFEIIRRNPREALIH